MRFYTRQHQHYCGVDLHARSMYVCVLDQGGEVRLHRDLRCEPESFLRAVAPFREDLVVAVECLFCWYWLADLCTQEGITFVLGHPVPIRNQAGKAGSSHELLNSWRPAPIEVAEGSSYP